MADRLPLAGAERPRRLPNRTGHGTERLAGGEDHHRNHQQRQGEGTGEEASVELEPADKKPQTEQAVDDRRDADEIGNVDFDERRQGILFGIFFHVNRCGDTERQRDDRRQPHHPKRSDPRRVNPRLPGPAGGEAGEKLPIEPRQPLDQDVDQQYRQHEKPEAGRGGPDGRKKTVEHPVDRAGAGHS